MTSTPQMVNFQAAVGSPGTAPLRQTRSMAPASALRVAEVVASYDRASMGPPGTALERHSADGCALVSELVLG